MKNIILVLTLAISFKVFGADKEVTKSIKKGTKEEISCPGRHTFLFCDVDHTFGTPGICGHGFDCILMKAGEKESVCNAVFNCEN